MTTYSFVSTELARPKSKEMVKYDLSIRQQPEQAKVCTTKERDRRPVDPPPIIQLKVLSEDRQVPNYLQNPYLFICATLIHATEDTPLSQPTTSTLAGTTVSSLYRLKDSDNSEGGFFVFADASVKLEGTFRLKFSLFELAPPDGVPLQGSQQVSHIVSICSQPFTVFSSKAFPGMLPSTFLSRSFSDQGVRIRIRKENRIQMNMYENDAASRNRVAVSEQRRPPEELGFVTQQPARASSNVHFVEGPRSDPQRYINHSPTAGSFTSRSTRRNSQPFHPYNYQPISSSLFHAHQFPEQSRTGPRHTLWRSPEHDSSVRSCLSPRHSPVNLPRIEPYTYQAQSLPGPHHPYPDYQSGSSSESSRRLSENSNKSMVLPSPPEHRYADVQQARNQTSQEYSNGKSILPSESLGHQHAYGLHQSHHGLSGEQHSQFSYPSSMKPRVVDNVNTHGNDQQRAYKADHYTQQHSLGVRTCGEVAHGSSTSGLPNLSRPHAKCTHACENQAHIPSPLQTSHGGLRLPPIQSYGEDRKLDSTRQSSYPYNTSRDNHAYRY